MVQPSSFLLLMLPITPSPSLAGEQSRPRRLLPPLPLSSSPNRSSRPLPKIPGAITCKKCATCITSNHAHLLPSSYPPGSRAFKGFLGKASLFAETYNVKSGRPSVQLMATGAHTMQELSCAQCSTYIGWRIVRAHERSERWKEGYCLLELECLASVGDQMQLLYIHPRDGTSSDTDSDYSLEHISR